jgi:MoaA/NifB/PqqE/SkfB family radical SAM enzyme
VQLEAFCPYPFTRVRVTAEGDLSFCGHQTTFLGNILQQNFDEIWFSETADAVREATRGGVLHSCCGAGGCPYRNVMSLKPKKVGYGEYPSVLEIEMSVEPNIKIFERLVHLMPSLGQIDVRGAEPFMNNRLVALLDHLRYDQHSHRIHLIVTTSCVLDEVQRTRYIRRVPSSTTICRLDAASPSIFRLFHPDQSFDKTVEGYRTLCSVTGRGRQIVVIRNRLNEHNLHEAVPLVSLCYKMGADQIEFEPDDGPAGPTKENCGIFKRTEAMVREEGWRLKARCVILKPLDNGLMDELVKLTL